MSLQRTLPYFECCHKELRHLEYCCKELCDRSRKKKLITSTIEVHAYLECCHGESCGGSRKKELSTVEVHASPEYCREELVKNPATALEKIVN